MAGSVERRYRRVAYGKIKDKPGAGTVINVGSRVGAKIVQVLYFRSSYAGYKAGSRR